MIASLNGSNKEVIFNGSVSCPVSIGTSLLASYDVNVANNLTVKRTNVLTALGSKASLSGSEVLTNKTVTDSSFTIQDDADNTKKVRLRQRNQDLNLATRERHAYHYRRYW